MIFFVFSFNRGPHLKNAIESIEHCSPGSKIIVYDDNSSDPETQTILRDMSARHEVRITGKDEQNSRHGGLYNNMQHALDSLTGEDQLICFMQDDTQLVRPITSEDLLWIRKYFESNPQAGFLAPVFLRKLTKKRTLDRFIYVDTAEVYFCKHVTNQPAAGIFYSDISISTSQRLRSANWQFDMGEYENELLAKTKFTPMGYMYAPFLMWNPNPPAYRNKKKTFAFKLAEKFNKSGLYKFCYMPGPTIEKLKTRPTSAVAIAEDYLDTEPPLRKPWIFEPLKRSRVLRKLDKLEKFMQKTFK